MQAVRWNGLIATWWAKPTMNTQVVFLNGNGGTWYDVVDPQWLDLGKPKTPCKK